ncbi:hypothetical protein A2U01_0103044, partial [Trifolium medium]|nr:hypothetical protein [Trifolium medium]
ANGGMTHGHPLPPAFFFLAQEHAEHH